MPPRAYQQPPATLSRIDTILGLYDQALEKTERALAELQRGDRALATQTVAKTKLAVGALVCMVVPNRDELSTNLLRLFEFVTHNLDQVQPDSLTAASRILRILRTGFERIREDALRLERAGAYPPLQHQHQVRTLA